MAWKELFSTDIGLLSLFTIGFVVVMGAYFGVYFSKKMNEKPGQK
ncbi:MULTISPECIES: DUF3149 domain-containing protein [Azospira]|jgi:hypothetical protein|uniref:DUF3149 domain-containing protein n=2 Tax=Azospira oryzae TaxID=146939 RepID=G8QPW1_AZOOP|nr:MULTISPECIES: DUF3149 domain-containing protein [Azospira]TLS18531.1 MAG: DUF3149 domain-containing protein [Betaproteobacteria bacterium]AEV26020.1 Protein of unknown function (DUF3149) [Azospira oryzae PS]MDK9690503.1 DUF3149 domain-containing protein [Azospira sp.]RZT75715.1 uncharacterized protein DUF3149 [Azospira oryzae]BBN90258.1 hypothetical protein AZSP09_32810 [Azospira sp. I09]